MCSAAVLATLLCFDAATLPAQSALDRTPNMSGGWTGDGGSLHFNFVHRFNQSGPPQRQVQSRPTFLLAWSLPWHTLVGVHYSTRSALAPGVANEWEPFARVAALRSADGAPADAALQVGYNAAAQSVDGELGASRVQGPLRVLLALRAFSSSAAGSAAGAGAGESPGSTAGGGSAAAVIAGAALRTSRHTALSGDIGRLVHGAGRRATVWSAGVQLHLPATPHSISLHATNTDAVSLHSASIAASRVRWGFEFTIPITPARYLAAARASARNVRGESVAAGAADGDTTIVRASLHNLRFVPDTLRVRAGTTIEWRNDDPLEHTVAAADGSWDSGDIAPGATWRRRFDTRGTHELTCGPHPFMRAVVVVQ